MSGVVYLCPNCFDELATNDELSIHRGYNLKLNGYQFGEKFGQTNLAIDINGDGYDDLVVGAPLHSSNSVSTQCTKSSNIQLHQIQTCFVLEKDIRVTFGIDPIYSMYSCIIGR